MKKTLASFISFSMLMGSLFTLASCGGTKLPATKYEKVEFALNGVESSFRDAMNSKRKVEPLKQERFNDGGSSESLNTIFGLFTEGDYRGSNLDEELTYGEPPMAQFQCVKKALEKIGSNFSFGTKYFDDVTGSAYIDFETGFKAETKPEFKYDYTFTLGLELNIDDNDFITADVSFDIALAKDGKTYAVNWYVGMDLTYDMTKTEPTYKLLMITENDEVALPYFNRYVYEYDYVDTNNNKINEWRKFVLETNEKLYKDATHQDFSSYMNKEGFIFQAETCAWYKNSKLYKFTERKHDREVTFASELFANIGLNSTVINCGPFINKAGTRNSVIKDLYAEFSRIR